MNKKIIIVLLSVILVGMGYLAYKEMNPNNETITSVDNIDTTASTIDYEKEEVTFDEEGKVTINLSEVNDIYNITSTGVYYFTGTLNNGYIKVNTTQNVEIILDNVTITNNSGPCIYIENANNTYIKLIGENTLTDGENYNGFTDVNACIFSKDDLIIYGEGTLNIKANYQDGIVSKDDLTIENGILNINSKDDAIRGKDSVVIENGTFNIEALSDGIKSTNDTDTDKGNILIINGTFNIKCNQDAIQSENNLEIDNGVFNITTNNGAKTTSIYRGMDGNSAKTTESSKAIKAVGDILIKNGTFDINSYDDAIHSDDAININGGEFKISTSDDGIHADNSVTINNGTINITNSYEGIEANYIIINDGNIKLVARDDGINVSGGADSSGFGGRGRTTNTSSNNKLVINGGNIYVNSTGDGLDANGSIYLTGGTIYVDGPTDNGNASLDYDGNFEINEGTIVAAGSSGMMQNATNSNQGTVLIYFNNTINGGTSIKIGDISYTPSKNFNCILISSNTLKVGNTYDIMLSENKYESITLSNTITSIGNGSMVNGMGRGGRGRY